MFFFDFIINKIIFPNIKAIYLINEIDNSPFFYKMKRLNIVVFVSPHYTQIPESAIKTDEDQLKRINRSIISSTFIVHGE